MIYQDKQWLKEKYCQEGLILDEMAELAGCCQRTIVNWMDKYGIQRREPASSRWPNRKYLNKQWLEQMYHCEHLTQAEIGKICNVEQSTISTQLQKHGLDARPGGRTLYFTDHHLFHTWSHDSAYILGLIATDGSINATRATLSFKSKDRQLAEFVHHIVGKDSNRPIFKDEYNATGPYYRVLICSKSLISDLESLGITPRKAFSLQWPPIPQEFIPSFISGVLDGDGHVGLSRRYNKPRLQIVIVMCAKNFMDNLVSNIRATLDLHGSYITAKQKNVKWHDYYRFGLETRDSRKMLDWLYAAPCPHLDRKKAVYLEYLSLI